MRKIIILISLICITNSYAQINIGKSKSPINLYVSKHKQGVFDDLKKTKTIFVVPTLLDTDEFKSIIKEVWTFNEFVFVDQETYDEKGEEYVSAENSIVRLVDNGYQKQKTGGAMGPGTRTVAEYIVFKFMMLSNFENIKKNKKGKLKYDALNIAEMFFTPNIRYRQDFSSKVRIGSSDKINEKYGEEPGFYNFDMGYIKNYFQELNRRLSNSENLVIEDGVEKKEKIKELKDKTLYAPKWILKKYNALAASWGQTRTEEELFGKYGYKYEVVDNKSINDKILKGDDFYYLMHTQFNQKKVVSVIHSVTGEIIYLSEEGSYNIKDSDIKSIAKLIK
ncbi:hypothetical protein [Aquimarina sp. 2304DJ70-9]|uniref:hypothetical protein n=1 Tax=Aquimarina penaris TaxID=3231044 RepID=UPI003461F41B